MLEPGLEEQEKDASCSWSAGNRPNLKKEERLHGPVFDVLEVECAATQPRLWCVVTMLKTYTTSVARRNRRIK